MLKRIRKLFAVPTFRIVEVENPRVSIAATRDVIESVHTLAAHPGFIYLLNKLKVQRAALETKLTISRHVSLSEVEFIQSGIFWTNWLPSQLELAVLRLRPGASRPATEEEGEAFQQILNTIKPVGIESNGARAS